MKALTPWLFLFLPLCFYAVFVAYPIVFSLILSFFEWDGISSARRFIGVDNFRFLFSGEMLPIALKNNSLWMLFFVPLPLIIGFFLALSLRQNTKLNVLLRSVFYLPMILSFTVMSIMWSWVYEPTRGVITQILEIFSIPAPERSILTRPDTSLIAIVIVGIWHWIGFPLVLYLAALKDIPKELFETAEIDGASWYQKIAYIVIPLVRHATLIAISIGVVLSVKVFDLVFLMAGGYYKNEVLSTLIWTLAFDHFRMGTASAVSIIQFFIVIFILVPYIWYNVTRREVEF
jgi:ABC-type sugar transport system permease subunit